MGCSIVVNQAWAGRIADALEYRAGFVDKQDLLRNASGAATLFSFDRDQRIGEHAAPFDALMLIVEGRAEVTVAGRSHALEEGGALLVPAHQPHTLHAPERFKMLLVTLRA